MDFVHSQSAQAFSGALTSTPSGVKSGCRVELTNSWNLNMAIRFDLRPPVARCHAKSGFKAEIQTGSTVIKGDQPQAANSRCHTSDCVGPPFSLASVTYCPISSNSTVSKGFEMQQDKEVHWVSYSRIFKCSHVHAEHVRPPIGDEA